MICRNVALATLCMLHCPLQASAAEPSRDLATLDVRVGTIVYVRTTSDADLQGVFVRSSTSELVIVNADAGPVTLAVDQIARVWKRGDRLRNGALIGGLFGLAGALSVVPGCTDCLGAVALRVVSGVPVWAGIGALIDHAHTGRTLIYRSP